MKKAFAILMILALLVGALPALAESILLMPQTPPPTQDIEVISLNAVTWAGLRVREATEDGGLRCYYHTLTYQGYERFGVKLGEEGFSLVNGETLEDGTIRSVVSDGAIELIIEYDPEGEKAWVTYPPHVFPRERRRYEDYEPVSDGDTIALYEGITATVEGWEKVDAYSYYWINENWIPSKRENWTKQTGEDGQMARVTFHGVYDRLDDRNISELLKDVHLEWGENTISCQYGRVVEGQTFRYDDDILRGNQEFTYVVCFALTEEQLEHLDEIALTFTDWYSAVPYAYMLQAPQAAD